MKHKLILIGLLIAAITITGCATPTDIAQADIQPNGNTIPEQRNQGEWQPIDTTTSTFEFEGYAPGKSHTGTFTFYEGELEIQEGEVIGARGTIDATSVKSDGERLEQHLRSDDFFDVEQYPKITFESTSIADGTMTGELTFHGVKNTISFPVTTQGRSISAEFLLDTTPYGMKYAAVDKDVRIAFTMTT